MKARAGPYGPIKVHNDPDVLYMNEVLGGNYTRPRRTQTGMSSYRPPYISSYVFT